MGTPIHRRPPATLGETCTACDPDIWGEGKSPKLCRAVFHNITAELGCPAPPNNLPFYCEQYPGAPCMYQSLLTFGGYDWVINYYAAIALLTLDLWLDDWRGYFWGYAAPCMGGPFPNDFLPGSGFAYGGSGYVLDLPVHYITTLADDYALGTDPTGLYEDDPSATPGYRCIRFAGRTSPGSCWIKADVTALE